MKDKKLITLLLIAILGFNSAYMYSYAQENEKNNDGSEGYLSESSYESSDDNMIDSSWSLEESEDDLDDSVMETVEEDTFDLSLEDTLEQEEPDETLFHDCNEYINVNDYLENTRTVVDYQDTELGERPINRLGYPVYTDDEMADYREGIINRYAIVQKGYDPNRNAYIHESMIIGDEKYYTYIDNCQFDSDGICSVCGQLQEEVDD